MDGTEDETIMLQYSLSLLEVRHLSAPEIGLRLRYVVTSLTRWLMRCPRWDGCCMTAECH